MGAQSYEIGRVPRTLVGAQSLDSMRREVDALGGTSAVLIVDGAVAAGGYLERLVDSIGALPHTVHVVPPGEPTIDSVDAAAALVRTTPDAVVIGVGGGSALDVAKQAAVVGSGDTGVEPYLLCATPLPGRRPIVAIPTTSGTGAEVTRTCIVSDRSGRKTWTWGDEMLPDLVVLDPTAAMTMPHAVTVATGLDAFVHAIEACSGVRRSSVAAAPAQRALRLVVEHLPRAAAVPDDLTARQGMQEAAFLAGVAIDNCGTGIAHSIGHALGTLHHLPHGLSVAVGLLATLRWNVDGAPDAYADAAIALDRTVDELPECLAQLSRTSGLGVVAASVPCDPIDAGALASTMAAPENQPMLQNNARRVDDEARMMLAASTVVTWGSLARG
ncbi:MAG: iron-containing alcohol dehydrogenase [Actinobacteria bacterium]|nr:iron-containing alcohol dehydrogenase [Actinomycetota bacterium]